jgi:hypothetical protein
VSLGSDAALGKPASRQRDHGELARFGECDFDHRAVQPFITAARAALPCEQATPKSALLKPSPRLLKLTATAIHQSAATDPDGFRPSPRLAPLAPASQLCLIESIGAFDTNL